MKLESHGYSKVLHIGLCRKISVAKTRSVQKRSPICGKVKHELRVTNSNSGIVSLNLRVTSSNYRDPSSNPQVTSSNLRVTCSNLRVTSSNPQVKSSNP